MLDFIVVIFSAKMLGRHFRPDGYLLHFCRQFYYLGKKIVSKYGPNFRPEYGLKARPDNMLKARPKEGFAIGYPFTSASPSSAWNSPVRAQFQ